MEPCFLHIFLKHNDLRTSVHTPDAPISFDSSPKDLRRRAGQRLQGLQGHLDDGRLEDPVLNTYLCSVDSSFHLERWPPILAGVRQAAVAEQAEQAEQVGREW